MPYKKNNKSTVYNSYGNKRNSDDRYKKSYNGITYTKDPVIIPYNSKNKLIRDVDLKNILSRYDIKLEVVDIDLYRQALTHKSYIKKEFYSKNYKELEKAKKNMDNVLDLQDESNERLEFLGDTVIKLIVAEYLYDRYPKEAEGFMTRLKTNIEDKRSLARFSKIFLNNFLQTKNPASLNKAPMNDSNASSKIFSFVLPVFEFSFCAEMITNSSN